MEQLIQAELRKIYPASVDELQVFFNVDQFTPPVLKFSCEGSKFNWTDYDSLAKEKKISGKLLKQNYEDFLEIHLRHQHTGYGELHKVAECIVRCEPSTTNDYAANHLCTKLKDTEKNELYLLKDLLSMSFYLNQNNTIPVQENNETQICSWSYGLSKSNINELKILGGTLGFFGTEQKLKILKERFTSYLPSRLVLTPSYSRYVPVANSWLARNVKCADIWNDAESMNTIHVIVVRPFQTEVYKRHFCQNGFIVASIPENEESVGSARYWCMIIAHALGFHWTFMLDDSFHVEPVRCAVFQDEKGPSKTTERNSETKYPVLQGVLLMEHLQKKLGEEKCMHVGILSLRRYNGQNQNKKLITTHFCQGFQLIHVEQVMKNNVYFRRGLHFGEDLLFSQDCCDARLATLMLTHVQYYDQSTQNNDIKESGVHSPNQAINSKTPDSVQRQLLPAPVDETVDSIQQLVPQSPHECNSHDTQQFASTLLKDDVDLVSILQPQMNNLTLNGKHDDPVQ